ncbi:MAG TPA: S1 RNA-binding domain-containing protein, partial [Acidimicrobiales bacterium]|nr:S1 RNA-binding domain-containing protein [Acidimicrobiales bacterium]
MPFQHVVVDGSNIATEGRSLPSLAQLDEAVREFQKEFPDVEITVVVDATFGHRIEEPERQAFQDAQAHGELVSPPAGAIGRGDAFLLRVADKAGATVLSNDSFQEFHGEYEWLFDRDRLVGGKPVAGVGWIFTPRTPVRGPKSRESVREARKQRVRIGSREASQPMPVPKAPPPRATRKAPLQEAIAAATEEAVEPAGKSGRRRRKRSSGPPPEAVNDPLTFITFVANHQLGHEVTGEVDSFASHGAFVLVEGARCYVPLSALGDPPPRSARQVLSKGQPHQFVVQALDPQRRGIELAWPGFAHVSGAPQEETVEAEIASTSARRRRGQRGAGRAPGPSGPAEAAALPAEVAEPAVSRGAEAEPAPAPEAEPVPAKARKAGAKKAAVAGSGAGTAPAKKARAPRKAAVPTASAGPEAPATPTPAPAAEAEAPKAAKAPAKKAAARKA